MAYESAESGQNEIYVQSFPAGLGKRRVSPKGGRGPRWTRNGSEIIYLEGDNLVAVAMPEMGAPRELFSPRIKDPRFYDVSADGERFALIEPEGTKELWKIRVVQNWYEEFRDREQD